MDEYGYLSPRAEALAGGSILICSLMVVVLAVLVIVATWKIYAKAGRPGWASLIPIYNTYILYDIAMGNGILFLLLLVPFVNCIISIIVLYKLSTSFGKGIGFTLGLLFLSPIFLCILGFGKAEYIGPQ